MEHISDGNTNCNWYDRYSHQGILALTGRLGNKRTGGDHPNESITKIGQNTKKIAGNLRLAVSQTPVEDHRLMLVGKIFKGVIIIMMIRGKNE